MSFAEMNPAGVIAIAITFGAVVVAVAGAMIADFSRTYLRRPGRRALPAKLEERKP